MSGYTLAFVVKTPEASSGAIDIQEKNVLLQIVNQAKPTDCNPWALQHSLP
jgi:hypothetical protein